MLLALSLVVAACTGSGEKAAILRSTVTTAPASTTTTTIPPAATTTTIAFAPATLIHVYSCSFFVSRGNADGTVRLQIRVDPDEDTGLAPGMASVGRVPDRYWGGSVYFGSDLFAFYCQDVIDSDAPQSVVTATWEIVDGTLDIVSLSRGERGYCHAHLAASGLVARAADGRLVDVGDFEFFNEAWGHFPGQGGGVATCGDDGGT